MLKQFNELHNRLSLPVRCVLAVGIFFFALLLRLLVLPVEAGFANITFYPLMVASFFLCGTGPGFLMAILSASTSYYIFIPPHFEWQITRDGNLSAGAFLICACFVAYIFSQMQSHAKTVKSLLESSQKSETLYRHVLSDQTESIFRFLPDHTITYVNDAFRQYFGRDSQDFIGKKWESIVLPEDLPFFHYELNRLSLDHPVADVEVRVVGNNEDMHWCRFVNRGIFDDEGHLKEVQSVGRDCTSRKNLEEELKRLAFTDSLTRLSNRRLLQDRLRKSLITIKRTGKSGALFFIDLDNFKPINDRYGHEAGDLLLIEAAQRIKSCVREMDTVARIGGDEFVAMVGEFDGDLAKSVSYVKAIAEKIGLALAEPYLIMIENDDVPRYIVEHLCTASIGVVQFPQGNGSAENYLRWADRAMYQAKDAGRNAIRFYESAA